MRPEQSDADGFVMVVLIIVMGIGAVWMAAALPAWKQQATREKEAELVFRGNQYVRALQLYQQKNGPQTRPSSIDVLVDNKFLRKKYKDPITNDDFVPVLTSSAPITPGAPVAGQQQTPGQGGLPVQPAAGRAGGAATPPAAAPGGGQGNAGSAFGGQIMGVMSKSTATSILVYKGASHYNEWDFRFAGSTQNGRQGGAGAPAGPGGANNGRGGPAGTPGGPGIGTGGRGGPAGGPVVAPGPGRAGGGAQPPTTPVGGRGRGGL